ncbi:MAG: DUF3352 domain-containing protein [Candidatus Eremiobacterota bacterium]
MSYDDEINLNDNDEEEDLLDSDDTDDDTSDKSQTKSYSVYIISFLLGVILCLGAVIFYLSTREHLQELSFMPEEAQMIVKIQIEPGIKKVIFTEQYKKIHENPDTEKNVYASIDKLMITVFFREPRQGINITADFLPYVDPEMAVAGFNMGANLAVRILRLNNPVDKIFTLGAFRINNREKVDEFFNKVRIQYGATEQEMNGHKIFVSTNFSYVFYRDFVLMATTPDKLLLSLDTVQKKHKSILTDAKFQLYRKKISKDTVGFAYVNLNYLRDEFCNISKMSQDSNFVQFFKSVKIMGAALALSEKGLSLETLIVPEENITNPVAVKYFSQTAKEPVSLTFFAKDSTTNLLVLTNIVELFEVYTGLTEDILPGVKDNLDNLVESRLSLNLERDIFASLTGELAISYPSRSAAEFGLTLLTKPQKLFDGLVVMAGVKQDSRLESLIAGADSLISLLAPPPQFKGVSIITAPDGSISYACTDHFIILGMGKSRNRIQELIATKKDNLQSLNDLYKERTFVYSGEVLGVTFINIKLLYEGLGTEAARSVEKTPELWIVNSKADTGIKATLYIPFKII